MPLKIKFGTIKKISLTSDPYYDVHFEDGSVLRVFHRLVQPARSKFLKPGCRLSVGINEGRVEWASTDLTTPENKEDKKERFPPGKYIVTVKDVNPSNGIVTVATSDGKTIRVRLQKHEQIWSKVFMGRKLELEVMAGLDGKSRYSLSPEATQTSSKTPGFQPSTTPTTDFTKPRSSPPPSSRVHPFEPLHPVSQPDSHGKSEHASSQKVSDSSHADSHSYRSDADWVGIDPAYFSERQKENHRYEIMAFLEDHLEDNLIEWYQMRLSQTARYRQPESPLVPEVEQSIHTIDQNFSRFYHHQALALDAIRAGKHLVVVTQTASGKTLCYNPAIFEHFYASNPGAHALYIFPLNALLLDQKEKIDQLVDALKSRKDIRAETLKGGLGTEKRHQIARESPNILATNPEMLGVILGEADKWQDFLSGLRYVVIDEVHSYRGILGMHMAGLIRRLLLTVRRMGQTPQFILSSATVSNPLDLATRLTSMPETSFRLLDETDDGSGQQCKHWAVLNPDYHQESGGYDQYLATAALAMVELLESRDRAGRPSPLNTILFAKSRRDVHKAYQIVQDNLKIKRPELAKKVRKYVSGDLGPEEKREIYEGLKSGELVGVISTNALEAGIDIGRLDACVIAGFPFWVMRMRQMAGRVGRSQEGLILYIPHPFNAIDQYYRDHPDFLLTQQPEVFVVDPNNPYISRKHINAAAFHLKGISLEELGVFGTKSLATAEQAIEDGVMRRNGNRFYGTYRNYQNTDDPYVISGIRSQQQVPYALCRENGAPCSLNSSCFDSTRQAACDRRIAVLDQQYAYRDCHPGAIYESMEGGLHRITGFDDPRRAILAQQLDDQSLERTFVEEETTLDLLGDPKARKSLPNGIELYLGEVQVTRCFTGYFTYTLVPRRRCRRCKITFDSTTHLCPRCSGQTTKFFDTSEMDRHDFPDPYPFGFTILLKTVVCWMTVPARLENTFESASPCKLPGEENLVRRFLSRPSTIRATGRRLQWSEQETNLVERYYETAGKLLRGRPPGHKETVLYPGVYGQCLLHALRESLEESVALEIFKAVTGYPVTDDLNHVCRKCQTSVLLPALHTLEHTVRMRYPSVALGDPTDLAGMTLLGHPQTGAPVIFWYDNYQGGLGAADKVFEQIERLIQASEATLSGCACTTLEGCPHCTQIGHCDKHNDSLSKLAARSLVASAKGMTFEIPYEPFHYPAAKKPGFDKESRQNEHRQAPQGNGSESDAGASASARAEGTAKRAASAETIFDPYQILRVQHKVHDPVLDKAYLVRSEEITRELPPVSAGELNQAYRQISELQRPQEWDIRPTMKPYEILEILPQASLGMIQRIYRVIAREIHPDVYPGDKKKANEMMSLVNETYEWIVKEKQKKEKFQNDL